MKKALFTFLFSASLLAAGTAFALDLGQARSSGAVAEKSDGYIMAVKPSGDVNALVADVNARRKAEYERISKENGQPASVVAKLAAQQVIGNLPSGSLYQGPDGSIKTK